MIWLYILASAFALHVVCGVLFWWWVRVGNPASPGVREACCWVAMWPFIVGLVLAYGGILVVQWLVDTTAEQCCLLWGKWRAS
jgi:hypothetical protein